MNIDLAKYSKELKASALKLFLGRDEKGKRKITDISDPYNTPCIVIVYWCAEVSGWPDYLKVERDFLINFYAYEEILNVPEGCPWSEL